MMKTILKNPIDLRKHWTRKLLPDPSPAHINNISDEITRGTKLPPIYVVENQVVAGWTRTLAHRAQQRDIHCIELTEEEAINVALGENTIRQSYPFKYQVAWVYCPLAIEVMKFAEKRRHENLRHARTQADAATALPLNIDDLAGRIGVSRKLLGQIKEDYLKIKAWDEANEPRVWGDEREPRTALEYFNDRILDPENPCTPGNCIAGLGGKKAGEDGRTNPTPRQLSLFTDGLAALAKWGKSFTQFADADQRRAVESIRRTVGEWPAELRAEFMAELKRVEREAKEAQS